jgi:chemotaxis protein MotB
LRFENAKKSKNQKPCKGNIRQRRASPYAPPSPPIKKNQKPCKGKICQLRASPYEPTVTVNQKNMQKSRLSAYLVCAAVATTFVACVPARQFNDLKLEKDAVSAKYRDCQNDKRAATQERDEKITTLALRDKTITELQRDTANIYPLYRRVKSANADLNNLYEKAIAQSNALASSAVGEKRELSDALTKKENELNRKELDLIKAQLELTTAQNAIKEKEQNVQRAQAEATKAQAEAEKQRGEAQKMNAEAVRLKAETEKLQANSNQLQGNLSQTQTQLAAREQRVQELETLIAAQKAKSDELRNKLSTALTGFNSNELTVTQKNGKVYVSLSQELLFASGSTEVNKKGKEAIGTLAGVLTRNPDIEIAVEGHTDNVPFKGAGTTKDNWDLSVLRATTIVRLLTSGGVAAQRVTAAGHGEYLPVAENSTADGKAKNRRTEIILSPKLDDLYNILKN